MTDRLTVWGRTQWLPAMWESHYFPGVLAFCAKMRTVDELEMRCGYNHIHDTGFGFSPCRKFQAFTHFPWLVCAVTADDEGFSLRVASIKTSCKYRHHKTATEFRYVASLNINICTDYSSWCFHSNSSFYLFPGFSLGRCCLSYYSSFWGLRHSFLWGLCLKMKYRFFFFFFAPPASGELLSAGCCCILLWLLWHQRSVACQCLADCLSPRRPLTELVDQ